MMKSKKGPPGSLWDFPPVSFPFVSFAFFPVARQYTPNRKWRMGRTGRVFDREPAIRLPFRGKLRRAALEQVTDAMAAEIVAAA